MDVLEWDEETQTAQGDEASFEAALNHYFNDLWGMLHIQLETSKLIHGLQH